MKKLIRIFLLALMFAVPAWGQRVIITQGGNDASVGAGGALKINLGEIGGTAQSGANVIDVGNTAIRVNIVAGGGAGGTSSSFGAAFPATGTAIGFSDGTNMQGGRVVDLDTGAGTVYGQIINLVRRASGGPTELIGQTTMALSLPVAIASDQGAVPASQSGTWTVQPGNTANTTAWLVTGTGGTFPSTQSGTWTVQPGNTANTTAWLSTSVPSAASAAASSIFYNQAVTTAQTVKASAGNVYGWKVYNPNPSVCYLQVFNTTTPTLGTTVPLFSIPMSTGFAEGASPGGVALNNFSTAIAVAATTTPQGATTCTTGAVVNIWYQ